MENMQERTGYYSRYWEILRYDLIFSYLMPFGTKN